MNLDLTESLAFTLAAIALLGSPGPGIAALVAVGRTFKVPNALRFFGAMQVGLAIAAGSSALGLAGLIQSVPGLKWVVMIAATVYLVWLAWVIGSAPVSDNQVGEVDTRSLTYKGAFFLGVANPKAYLAFASLFGSFVVVRQGSAVIEATVKWSMCVLIMIVIDLAWVGLGMALGRLGLSRAHARALNIVMGATILVACVLTWL